MILIVAAGSYAWFTWSSGEDSTKLTMTIGNLADVSFTRGNDITTGFTPVFNYFDGQGTTFSVKTKTSDGSSYNVKLNIASIDPELTNNESVKYALVKDGELVANESLKDAISGSSISIYNTNFEVGTTSYVFYLYIDSNMENNPNMIGKTISGNLTIVVAEDEMVVDGLITYDGEYKDANLFFSDSTRNIYTKISGGGQYLYVLAYDQDLVGQDISNTSLYIESNDQNKPSTAEGYMLWYESNLILCDSYGCANNSPLQGYLHQRAIGDGIVEFMIPVSVIGITSVDDIRNLKILYKNSSWNEVKDSEIIYEYNSNSIKGKTAVIAKKPSDWNDMYIYVYGDKTPIEWPGIRMHPFNNGSGDNYIYVLPDNISEAHVIFNNKYGTQSPAVDYDIFKIDKGQIKYWNGIIEDYNVNNWSNYDNSTSSDKNIYFKMKLPNGVSSDKGACVHIYDDNSDKTGNWPGLALSYSIDSLYWEGSFAATGNYNNLRVIFNNCNNGYQIPNSIGILIKPGITISYNGSKWIVLKDN